LPVSGEQKRTKDNVLMHQAYNQRVEISHGMQEQHQYIFGASAKLLRFHVHKKAAYDDRPIARISRVQKVFIEFFKRSLQPSSPISLPK
jgi:hypothetical protein